MYFHKLEYFIDNLGNPCNDQYNLEIKSGFQTINMMWSDVLWYAQYNTRLVLLKRRSEILDKDDLTTGCEGTFV